VKKGATLLPEKLIKHFLWVKKKCKKMIKKSNSQFKSKIILPFLIDNMRPKRALILSEKIFLA